MKKLLVLLLSLMMLAPGAWGAANEVARKPLPLRDALQDKNFYVLSILQRDPHLRSLAATDLALAGVRAERVELIGQSLRSCKDNSGCLVKAWNWNDEEIRTVMEALRICYRQDAHLRDVVETELRASGAYARYRSLGGDLLLAYAWEDAARGLNEVLDVYGEGKLPRYPQIDSASVSVSTPEFDRGLRDLAQRQFLARAGDGLFFEPSLETAVYLLRLNHRDEAGRFEPMEAQENKAALGRLPSIAWKKYPYSVIVVPGAGPSDPDTPLSSGGHLRVQLAAEQYRQGKAPFILVSGGYVHPSQTRFCEAIEMKKALMTEFGIPENAILIDPHARHTTTNMRNAAREVYRYGIPFDLPMLVVSHHSQVAAIASQAFANRCLRELGYVPYRLDEVLSPTALSAFPEIDSLQIDAIDPLDP